MPPQPDFTVRIVDANGDPDSTVAVIDGITDLNPSLGDVLQWNGTAWTNVPGDTPGAHAASHAAGGGDAVTLTEAQITSLMADLGAKVDEALWDANSIVIAVADNTPLALSVGASTFVGRKATGDISAMSATEAKAVLAIAQSDVTSLVADLALKAPLASPTFTGTVTMPTGANVTQSTNGNVSFGVSNVNAGAAATAFVSLTNNAGANRGLFHQTGSGYTPGGGLLADQTLVAGVGAGGLAIQYTVGQLLGFHGATPVAQRAGAAQAAVVTTGAALAAYGFTEAQANSIVTLVNELRAALVAKGLIKGAA